MISVKEPDSHLGLAVQTQYYIINFFSNFVDAGEIRRTVTVPRVRTSFLSDTKVPGSAMGNIILLFN
jgi:hypothetical protein